MYEKTLIAHPKSDMHWLVSKVANKQVQSQHESKTVGFVFEISLKLSNNCYVFKLKKSVSMKSYINIKMLQKSKTDTKKKFCKVAQQSMF